MKRGAGVMAVCLCLFVCPLVAQQVLPVLGYNGGPGHSGPPDTDGPATVCLIASETANLPCAYTNPPHAGDFQFITFASYDGFCPTVVQSSNGQTATTLHSACGVSGAGEYYIENSVGGATTINFTNLAAPSSTVVILMQPFKNVAHASSLDALGTSNAGSSCPTNAQVGSPTTTNADDLLIMYVSGAPATWTYAGVAPFVMFAQGVEGNTTAGAAWAYVTSTGTYTGQMVVTGLCVSGNFIDTTLAAFKAAP